jgi:hypothetical protein
MSKEEVRSIKALAKKQGIDITSPQATYWLMEKLQQIGPIRRDSITKYGVSPGSIEEGNFYFFGYLPQGRDDMPFYDMFPLVYVMRRQANGRFLGVNFHYLEYRLRAWFINSLLKYADTPRWDKDNEAEITAKYPNFKSNSPLRFYKPTIKSYRYDCIATRVSRVPPSEWKTALFMPLERFAKASSAEVYKWSRGQI